MSIGLAESEIFAIFIEETNRYQRLIKDGLEAMIAGGSSEQAIKLLDAFKKIPDIKICTGSYD